MKPGLVGAFGLLGIYSRYFINQVFRVSPPQFPWHTLTINLVGCFLIGIVYFLGAERNLLSEDVRVSLMVGLLGGFTTFSAFGLESFLLFKGGQPYLALLYIFASVGGGLMLTFAGYATGRLI